MRGDVAHQVVAADPAQPVDLSGVGSRLLAQHAHEDVVELALGESGVRVLGRVAEGEHPPQLAPHPEFLPQPPAGSVVECLAPTGMPAAGVGPEAAEVVLRRGALLEQEFAAGTEEHDREGPVQEATVAVSGELLGEADLAILLVDEDDLLQLSPRRLR